MDFSSLETWLDLMVILIALISLGVALYLALKLLKKDGNASPSQQGISGHSVSASAPSSPTRRTVFDDISAASSQPSIRSHREPDLLSDPPDCPAGFSAAQLRLVSGNKLVLALKNDGPTVIFKHLSTGPHNEVTITHIAETSFSTTLLPKYPQNSLITFHLEADHVISRTFQFSLFLGDLNDQTYRQDISGFGKEYPIIDPVVHVPAT